MSAEVVSIAPAIVLRAEKQRDAVVRNVAVALQAQELLLRTRVPTLGTKDMRVALQAARDRLEHEVGRLESVIDELLELEDGATDEGGE